MNAIKAKELRQMSVTELTKLVKERREALMTFRFNISGSKTKNVRAGRNIRRQLAKTLSVLKEKNAR